MSEPVVVPPAMPPGMPLPGQQMQIMLPQPLQDVMQQFPSVVARVAALEAKPAGGSPVNLVAAVAFLSGFGLMASLVFLWFYAAVLFRF